MKRSPTRLPWWLDGRGVLLHRMEMGLHEGGVARVNDQQIDDHPVLRGIVSTKQIAGCRAYAGELRAPFGQFRLVALLGPRYPEQVYVACLDDPVGIGTASPHRYGERGPLGHVLCLYYPGSPVSERWCPDEGIARLMTYARIHLWREHIWRVENFWPGPEAPHGRPASMAA